MQFCVPRLNYTSLKLCIQSTWNLGEVWYLWYFDLQVGQKVVNMMIKSQRQGRDEREAWQEVRHNRSCTLVLYCTVLYRWSWRSTWSAAVAVSQARRRPASPGPCSTPPPVSASAPSSSGGRSGTTARRERVSVWLGVEGGCMIRCRGWVYDQV